ncbi:alpha/beta fold hydrolase [Algoriphagus sp. SE2]|uniref:alpha/beta hydrolase n=1 Tax=Algoriphagus sp. SE2 TaxID=3141536 RepID=UPI0031CD624F
MKYLFKSKILFLLLFITTQVFSTGIKNDKTSFFPQNPVENTLIKHTVDSNGHPMAVWEKKADNPKGLILFVHGRTYSSIPDFDLQVEGEDLSLMDGMVEQGYSTYAVDLRGYGDTPRDLTEWLSPDKAAKDILNVLNWISAENASKKVHLFGWSMGSTSTLLATQMNAKNIASLTVFGYWQDLDNKIPESPNNIQLEKIVNTVEHAASDFITPGSISQKAIDTYVRMALEHDPIKVDWRFFSQFNAIDPSLITTPVLILQGEFDPISPTENQTKLFTRLKTADKSWVVISGGDHAAFLETPRKHFIHSFTSFIDRFNE